MPRNQFGFLRFTKKCILCVTAFACMHTFAADDAYSSDEEAFLIRRIAEFWKDGDYGIVKSQIHDFVRKYPKSALNDYLQGILGDLHLQENQFEQALAAYHTISDPSVHEKIVLNKLQCLYELSDYETLFQEGERYLSHSSSEFDDRRCEFHFLMAEGYFRHALTLLSPEQSKQLIEKSQPFYEQLLDTEYGEISSFALAEVYRLLKQNAKGADLYLMLASRHPDKKESLLFNAGLLEANLDKQAAIDVFDQVIELSGTKSGDAAYNRLLLYFQTQQYENVIANHRLVYPYVPEEQMSVFNFIVGKSFYALQDFESATTPLEKYIIEQAEGSDQYKDALLIQMTCARHTNNEPLFEKSLNRFKKTYPDDSELAKAHFMHAMILKNDGELARVEIELRTILDRYSSFEDPESLIYEYAIVTHQNSKYDLSYEMLKRFLSDYPNSERMQSAWRHFLSSCLHLSKQATDQEYPTYSKDVFLTDLQKVLHNDNGLNQDELREYRLLYAKLAYELNYYNESLENLQTYIADYSNHESLGEAHLLTALSLNRLSSDLEGFCSHLEKAIELNPELYDTSSIHLQLYNAYITRSEHSDNREFFIDKAAHYLYCALQDATQPIKLENQLWLGGYYYKNAKDYLDQHWANSAGDRQDVAMYLDRALELYDKALTSDKSFIKLVDSQSLYLEPEILKFGELAGLKGHVDSKLQILQALIEQQNNNPNWGWQFKRQTMYELASTYEDLRDYHAALETYDFINTQANSVSTPLTNASALKSAKLRFDLMDRKSKNEKNPDVIAVLNKLKELQIRKNILSEPTHLEAGIEYAKVRASLAQDNMRDSRYLFFLVRLKEDFQSRDDLVGGEYHSSLKENPEKETVFLSYMKFIDAEILRMQSKQLFNENNKEEGFRCKDRAVNLLSELNEHVPPTHYLSGEVHKSLKMIR
ncbi:hypothetical protein COB11_05335 [Candidatus Aerophobetes bacterium]|uniref:Outer membrane lipoprotein BamD-like domain-containing protein n=1 Tax=Aerophobetes bacterium TaxID=2030807 RepID=A0A2A4YF05_UNCAE|nr:MAG: hypothetical protein COB11_05335 [Candidatus Aerophobetes bacterium]